MPYQIDGADFLASRRYAGLFDDMGTGKSCTAIIAADRVNAQSVLVVAPKIALINWSREIAKWSPQNSVIILDNMIAVTDMPLTARWYLVNYDLLSTPTPTLKMLREMHFDLMILDECQAAKNYEAKRTQNIYGKNGIARCATRVWALSGTPAPNHPGELYSMLRAMFPVALSMPGGTDGALMSYQGFLNRYCIVTVNRMGRDKVVGARNMNQLRDILKPFALRRTMQQVLPDMPPMRFSTVTLDPGEALRHIEDDPDVKRLRRLLQGAMLEAQHPESDPYHLMNSISQLTDEEIPLSSVRRMFGQMKAPLVAEFVAAELEHNSLPKVVIFFHHTIVAEIINAILKPFGCAVVDGNVRDWRRQEAIDRFQLEPEARVLLVQIDVGSRAITLTSAAHVVFAEASWVPSDNVQAARRCARLGQTRTVLARFMTLAGSVDEIVMGVVARKAAILAELFPAFEGADDDLERIH